MDNRLLLRHVRDPEAELEPDRTASLGHPPLRIQAWLVESEFDIACSHKSAKRAKFMVAASNMFGEVRLPVDDDDSYGGQPSTTPSAWSFPSVGFYRVLYL